MNRRNFVRLAGLACAALALASVPAMAAAKPDFTGEWKLNIDKSDFGPIPPPTSQTQKIDHKDPVIKIVTAQNGMEGEFTTDATYTTDGKESLNKARGADTKTIAKWEGDSLVMDTKLDYQGTEITLKTTMAMAADGKSITAKTKIMTPQGDFDLSALLDRVK